MQGLRVRKAAPTDAAGIVNVLAAVTAERIHSAIDRAWTVDEETRYLQSLAPREVVHIAVDAAVGVVALQSLDLWAPLLSSMAHVGQVGTFLLPEWRRRGIGRQLWSATQTFAREARYRKLAIQVRGSNTAAQAFYRRLGFRECGRMISQVVIDGVEDDEVLMEYFC
jgi:ribosomal protein S18 acetylase RimI-like enzyme